MRELPYEFDLLHDIKMMYEVEVIAKEEPSHSDATPEELVDLFREHMIPLPACLASFVPKIRKLNYYDKQLQMVLPVLNSNEGEIKIKVVRDDRSTKWMNLNLDSIESLQAFIDILREYLS